MPNTRLLVLAVLIGVLGAFHTSLQAYAGTRLAGSINAGSVIPIEARRSYSDGIGRNLATTGSVTTRLAPSVACGVEVGYYRLGYDDYGCVDNGTGECLGRFTYSIQQVSGVTIWAPVHAQKHLRLLGGTSLNRLRTRTTVFRKGREWTTRGGAFFGIGVFNILSTSLNAQARANFLVDGNQLPGDRHLEFLTLTFGLGPS